MPPTSSYFYTQLTLNRPKTNKCWLQSSLGRRPPAGSNDRQVVEFGRSPNGGPIGPTPNPTDTALHQLLAPYSQWFRQSELDNREISPTSLPLVNEESAGPPDLAMMFDYVSNDLTVIAIGLRSSTYKGLGPALIYCWPLSRKLWIKPRTRVEDILECARVLCSFAYSSFLVAR